jgi:hypothetical protein
MRKDSHDMADMCPASTSATGDPAWIIDEKVVNVSSIPGTSNYSYTLNRTNVLIAYTISQSKQNQNQNHSILLVVIRQINICSWFLSCCSSSSGRNRSGGRSVILRIAAHQLFAQIGC